MVAAVAAAVTLQIVVWPRGRAAGGAVRHTLVCEPAGGTLPEPARACRRLAALPEPFAPIPPDAACTMVYGGPQEALVVGTWHDRRVRLRLSRGDGCAIAQWNRLRFLLRV